jgi:Ser-tRNA(Ala) deacylase AlaX
MVDASCDLSLAQRDSYCRRSTSRVLSCSANADGSFAVIVDDSCLYPEGGGQPCDGGSIGGVSVIRVDKLPGQPGVCVLVPSPLDVGTEVESLVDWPKRYDAMQHHTAQHLLSAVAGRVAHVDTVKWEFFPDSIVVDFIEREGGEAPAAPLSTLITAVEESTNEAIRAAAAVSWRLVSKEELQQCAPSPVKRDMTVTATAGTRRLVEKSKAPRWRCSTSV